jgi:hypothetical protein
MLHFQVKRRGREEPQIGLLLSKKTPYVITFIHNYATVGLRALCLELFKVWWLLSLNVTDIIGKQSVLRLTSLRNHGRLAYLDPNIKVC